MDIADGRVVSNFIVQALKGEDIIIYGDGSQTRSFCYVHDLIEGMVRLMDSCAGFTGPMNVGNLGEFTIRQLAEIIVELTDSKSRLVYEELPATLAKEELGWEPAVPLWEGIRKTIAYFKDII